MWPFAKKPAEQTPEKSEWQRNEELCSAFREWKPIGSKFEYLGRSMVATGHSHIEFVGYSVLLRPCLKADYADDLGKIHSIEFSAAEVMAMMVPNAGIQPSERSEDRLERRVIFAG